MPPRSGRELEETVATVEAALSGTGVEVRSPHRVLGRRSGVLREVDVWITGTLGSAPLSVMVECRDRGDPEDVTWIDDVVGKRDDVASDKVIVVSAQGFSKGARQAAEAQGIGVRTIEDLDPGDVLGWLGINSIEILRPHVNMEMGVDISGDLAWESSPEWKNLNTPQEMILETARGERVISPEEAWNRMADDQVWSAVPTDGSHQELHAVFPITGPPGMRLVMETPFGRAPVTVMRFDGELWFERETVPVERATRYLGRRGVIARSAYFSYKEGPHRLMVTLHQVEEAKIRVTVHPGR